MMKCKYCEVNKPTMKDLKLHFASKHPEELAQFNKQMRNWESLHEHELGKDCPICPHRGNRMGSSSGD